MTRDEIKYEDLAELARYRDYLRQNPRLTYLFVELTDQCNLACVHCGSSCSVEHSTRLDADLLIRTLETVAEDFDPASVMICLTGGEPLMHPAFGRIAEAIRDLGFSCGMTTNGTLIDSNMARQLRRWRVDSITLSLDGLEESHNRFRGGSGGVNSYQKTVEAIHALHGAGLPVQVTTVVHRQNYEELEAIWQLMLDWKVESWRVINIEPIGRALEHPELLLTHVQLRSLLDFIRQKRYDPRSGELDVCYGCSHYLTPAYEREVRDNYFICGSGIYVASILCNGDIYSCLDIQRRPELVQGNIATDRFSEAWYHRFREFRKDRTAGCRDCETCRERLYCGGDSAHTWDYDCNRPMLCFAQSDETQ